MLQDLTGLRKLMDTEEKVRLHKLVLKFYLA